jgi:hypothetical protein
MNIDQDVTGGEPVSLFVVFGASDVKPLKRIERFERIELLNSLFEELIRSTIER